MDYEFRPVLKKELLSYVVNMPEITEDTMDCSLGVNPYGYPEGVLEFTRQIDFTHMDAYPHDHSLTDKLIDYWKDVAPISKDEIFYCAGSVTGIYDVCVLFMQSERNEVIGFNPTFTDMAVSAGNYGFTYTGVQYDADKDIGPNLDNLLAALSDKTAFIYLDRPNNPLAFTLTLEQLERVVSAARDNGSYVFIDEAYAGFLPREESALALWDRYDNLIVLRSFSKGFGLANLRAGYLVTNAELHEMFVKAITPYVLSDMDTQICAKALEYPTHPQSHAQDIAEAKQAIREVIGKRIVMLPSDDRVPICTLMLTEEGNLQNLLLKYKVLAVSGVEYDGTDERYVRLRVTEKERMPELLKRLKAAEQG